MPHPKSLMLATLVAHPFDDPEWTLEIEWDGSARCFAVDEKSFALVSRNGLDMLRRFPDLKALAARLRAAGCNRWRKSSASTRKAVRRFSGCRNRRRSRAGLPRTRRSTYFTPMEKIA